MLQYLERLETRFRMQRELNLRIRKYHLYIEPLTSNALQSLPYCDPLKYRFLV